MWNQHHKRHHKDPRDPSPATTSSQTESNQKLQPQGSEKKWHLNHLNVKNPFDFGKFLSQIMSAIQCDSAHPDSQSDIKQSTGQAFCPQLLSSTLALWSIKVNQSRHYFSSLFLHVLSCDSLNIHWSKHVSKSSDFRGVPDLCTRLTATHRIDLQTDSRIRSSAFSVRFHRFHLFYWFHWAQGRRNSGWDTATLRKRLPRQAKVEGEKHEKQRFQAMISDCPSEEKKSPLEPGCEGQRHKTWSSRPIDLTLQDSLPKELKAKGEDFASWKKLKDKRNWKPIERKQPESSSETSTPISEEAINGAVSKVAIDVPKHSAKCNQCNR